MDILIKLKFDRQEGDNYYFIAGFYNEGLNLPDFGEGAFPDWHDFSNVLSALPATLLQGSYIGPYQVPTNLILRGVRAPCTISDVDLIEDLAADWENLLGFLFTNDYEVLYSPTQSPLPSPYNTALQGAEEAQGELFNLPVLTSQWPENEGEYESISAAYSVSKCGALWCPAFAWMWVGTGEAPENQHILNLIQDGPPSQDPYIDVRWWDTYRPTAPIDYFWGAYDTRYPQYDFDGWNYYQWGLIYILEGLSESFFWPIYPASDTIIPFLSPTVPGDMVTVKIPMSIDDAFVFPVSEKLPEVDNMSLPTLLGVALPLLKALHIGPNALGGISFAKGLDLRAKQPYYSIATGTYGVATGTYGVSGGK